MNRLSGRGAYPSLMPPLLRASATPCRPCGAQSARPPRRESKEKMRRTMLATAIAAATFATALDACRGAQASRVSTDLGGRRLADERAEGTQRQDPRTDIGPAHRQAPARAIQRDQADRQVKERDGRSRPRAVIQGLGAARPILYEWRRRGQELRDAGGNTDEASSLSNSHRDFVCIPRHSSGRWNRRGG